MAELTYQEYREILPHLLSMAEEEELPPGTMVRAKPLYMRWMKWANAVSNPTPDGAERMEEFAQLLVNMRGCIESKYDSIAQPEAIHYHVIWNYYGRWLIQGSMLQRA